MRIGNCRVSHHVVRRVAGLVALFCVAVVLLDRNQTSPYDFAPWQRRIVNAGSFVTASFTIAPASCGTYARALQVRADADNRLIDGSAFDQAFTISSASLDVPILMYHKVENTTAPCSEYWVTESLFERQMAALHAYGYTTVSLQDFLDYRDGVAAAPQHPVILTFDDGYQNLDTVVRPVLANEGFVATAFLPTNYIGTSTRSTNSWDVPEAHCPANMLLWSDTALHTSGFTVGSHTLSHPDLLSIPTAQAQQEIANSKTEIENRLGSQVYFFSYPYGEGYSDPTLRRYLREAGYRAAVGVQPGIANTGTSNVWGLPRVMIGEINSTMLDPAHPNRLFMRRVDPAFPVPLPTLNSVAYAYHNGAPVAQIYSGYPFDVVVTLNNNGDASDLRVTLNLDDNAAHAHAPYYEQTLTGNLTHGETRAFRFTVTVPAEKALGQHYYAIGVYDRHDVLTFALTGWQNAFQVLAPTTPMLWPLYLPIIIEGD